MPRQDRPEIRRDEIKDTSNILKKFFNVYTKEFFEKHNNLFGDNAFELHLITAKEMGRDMNNIAKRHKVLHNRFKNLSKVRTKNKNIEIA